MSWIHWLVWPILLYIALHAIWFGWKRHRLIHAVLQEAGQSKHKHHGIRLLTDAEKRAALYAPNPRQRGRQRERDPERISDSDLDDLDDMFGK